MPRHTGRGCLTLPGCKGNLCGSLVLMSLDACDGFFPSLDGVTAALTVGSKPVIALIHRPRQRGYSVICLLQCFLIALADLGWLGHGIKPLCPVRWTFYRACPLHQSIGILLFRVNKRRAVGVNDSIKNQNPESALWAVEVTS
jgi:hypothetical protein